MVTLTTPPDAVALPLDELEAEVDVVLVGVPAVVPDVGELVVVLLEVPVADDVGLVGEVVPAGEVLVSSVVDVFDVEVLVGDGADVDVGEVAGVVFFV